MLVPSKPVSAKTRSAASRIASRLFAFTLFVSVFPLAINNPSLTSTSASIKLTDQSIKHPTAVQQKREEKHDEGHSPSLSDSRRHHGDGAAPSDRTQQRSLSKYVGEFSRSGPGCGPA